MADAGDLKNKDGGVSRRGFLGMAVAAGAVAAGVGGTAGVAGAAGAVGAENLGRAAEMKDGIAYRTLGKTGEKISMMGLGGYHIGMQKDEQLSLKIIRTAIDNGINFLDNCWDYNGGASEVRMGKALREGYRHRVFLMTKLDGHDKKTAAGQIDESLKRLQTDHIDLMQFHEVIRFEDPDKIFALGGSLEAALEAKKAGKIRYIGFTGHKSPEIHLKMLETAFAHNFTSIRCRCR